MMKTMAMTMNTVSSLSGLSVMGSSYFFYFTKARFFAGLFYRAKILLLSGNR